MATPPNADSLELFKLLVDRQWHSYVQVRDAIAIKVPPGRALRRYEDNRRNEKSFKNRHHNDPLPPPSRKPEAEQIEIGQRSCAQSAITSWKRAGALLQRGFNEGREIKVRDGFTSWGIPGFEPGPEDEDPGSGSLGVTEVPPSDSEPPESERSRPERPSADAGEFVAALEPEMAPVERERKPVPATRRAAEDVKPVQDLVEVPDALSPNGGLLAPLKSAEWCELCGLTVGNWTLHDQWHREQNKGDTPGEMALLNESQLRDLLSSVVVDALDQFQVGLEGYMNQQFAQLESMFAASLRTSMRWADPSRPKAP